MGETNTEIRNQRELFEKAIKDQGEAFPELKEQHKSMVNALKMLVDETDRLYMKDNDGNYPPLTNEVQRAMINLYQNAINSVNQYKEGLQQIRRSDSERRAVAEPIEKMMDTFEELMGKDFKVLLVANKHGIKTLPAAIEGARTNTIDLGSQNTARNGANMSSRIRLKVPGNNGKMEEGFFTPSNKALPGVEIEIDKAFKKLHERTKSIINEKELRIIVTRISNSIEREYMNNRGRGKGRVDRKSFTQSRCKLAYTGYTDKNGFVPPTNAFDYLLENDGRGSLANNKNEIDKLKEFFKGNELTQEISDYLLECANIKNKYGVLEHNVKLDSTEKIDRRNSAMSDIAELLDAGNLLAFSEPMTVKLGDKVIEGTFMAKAVGDDSKIANMGTVFANPNLRPDYSNPNLQRQLADLQIIDFISGNVDRHMGNMVYQFDRSDPQKPKCIGIQGIDNDASFGNLNDGNARLPKVEEIGVIREKTALIVSQLTLPVLKTTLRNYNFSDDEMKAVITRTQNLQEAIKSNKIKTLSDEAFEDYSNIPDTGYFKSMKDMQEYKLDRLSRALKKESFENYKMYYKDFLKLQKPLEQMEQNLLKANENVYFGSEKYNNVMVSSRILIERYKEAAKKPTVENLKKVKKMIEDVKKLASEYQKTKKGKKLNQKEKKRMAATSQFLQLDETMTGSIDMMEKCSAKEDMLNKMKNKSYDELISNMVDKMTKNVNKYPANSEMHTKGELAIKSMKALAEIAKESVSPDIETQKKVATHMAVIINYDPSLMNKTELTYAYHQGGEKKRMTSAMDIVTFLTDVHVNEGLKEPVKNNINEKTAQKTAQKTQIKSANMK